MNTQQNKERWIFVIAFGLLSVIFNDLPLFDGMNRFLVRGMVGATGGILGALLYSLVANKGNVLKYGALAIGACIVLGLFYLMVSYYKKKEEEQKKKSPLDLLINSLSSGMEETLREPLDTNFFKPPALTKEERSRLITCEVCRYKGVNKEVAGTDGLA